MDNRTDSFTEVWRKLSELETLVKNSLASREWVSGELHQIRESAQRTESSIEAMSRQMGDLANEVKSSYAKQDELMKSRAEQERAEHDARMEALRDQTLLSILQKKWAPIGSFVLVAGGILALAGQLLQHYIAYVVHLPK